MAKKSNGVFIVGPVDQKSAPYHHSQYREIDPMGPPHNNCMFLFDCFHLNLMNINPKKPALVL